jgi:hypothetical protein
MGQVFMSRRKYGGPKTAGGPIVFTISSHRGNRISQEKCFVFQIVVLISCFGRRAGNQSIWTERYGSKVPYW